MSSAGAAPTTGKVRPTDLDEVTSIYLIPPLPYKPTLISEHKIRETMLQIALERQAKEREAALNGTQL